MGRIDVVDQDTAIRDTKHVSYKPRPGDDRYQTQPGIYGYAYQRLTGSIPKFMFDNVILGNKKYPKAVAEIETVETVVDDKRIAWALKRLKAIDRGIQAAIKSGDVAANPSVWNCKNCGYRSLCPYGVSG